MRLTRTYFPALLALVTLASAACGGAGRITGTGPLVTDNRRLTTITEIDLQAPVDLSVVRGDVQAVNVTAQNEIQPVLLTEVKGEKLTIRLAEKVNDMDNGTNVEVVIPALEDLTIGSQGNVMVRDLGGNKLKVSSSGQGNVTLMNVSYENLKLEADGQGDFNVSGRGEDIEIRVDGQGDVDAFDFPVEDAVVFNKAQGDVSVTVSKDLRVEISGQGDVRYRGEPKVDLKDDGQGELIPDN